MGPAENHYEPLLLKPSINPLLLINHMLRPTVFYYCQRTAGRQNSSFHIGLSSLINSPSKAQSDGGKVS